ncbi:MAG: XRE family transcriptional regulator [Microbacteriaceae bacterium]
MTPAPHRPTLIIRAIRSAQGMSLRRLAAAAGVSVGLVSQVERGLTEPSLETMRKIAAALNVPLFSLFSNGAHDVEVVRADARIEIKSPHGGIRYSRLSSSSGVMELLQGTLGPHGRSAPEPHTHPAHECVLVLSGRLTIHVDGTAHDLQIGDSCYFDSQHPHFYENTHEQDATFLLAVTPPSF